MDAAIIRDKGYSAVGGRKRIQRIIASCVICKTIRGTPMEQKMSDLPEHRLWRTPPFLHCGIDVFGPFKVSHGKKTRNNAGTRKVWVLILTCMYSRAVHLEMLESMDAASFRMLMTRFEAVRGECNYLRSDCGSNFMAVRNDRNDCEQLTPELFKLIISDYDK